MKQRLRCFTLIELLIAASIFSALTVSIYSAFNTGLLSYRKLDASFEVFQAARIIFSRLERDIRNAFAYSREDCAFKGDSQKLDFFAVIEGYNEDAEPYVDICRIVYGSDGKEISRSCYKALEALRPDAQPVSDSLGSLIEALSFEFATQAGGEIVWQKQWPQPEDNAQRATLPLAVKVTLSMLDKGADKQGQRLKENFSLIIPVGMAAGGLLPAGDAAAGAAP